jgi:hypothetical protein
MVFLLLLLGTRYLMPLCCPAVTRFARLRRACDPREVSEPVGSKSLYFE